MANIIDEKTYMIRVGSNDRKGSLQWKKITEQINSGGWLSSSSLQDWFERKGIPEAKEYEDDLTRKRHLLTKAAYAILQVSCMPTAGEKVGVFLRQKREGPTGREKLISGFSLLRSWSPLDTKIQAIQSTFEVKTGFLPGRPLEFKPFGLGYNDLLEPPELIGPVYLFMVYKAICSVGDFPVGGEQGATNKKSGETFIGFFDPHALYRRDACHQGEPIVFKGRMDNLVLRSFVTGERKTSSGELAAFNQDSWISADMQFKAVVYPTEEDRIILEATYPWWI